VGGLEKYSSDVQKGKAFVHKRFSVVKFLELLCMGEGAANMSLSSSELMGLSLWIGVCTNVYKECRNC